MKKKITGLVIMLVIILCLVFFSIVLALLANQAIVEKNKSVDRVIERTPIGTASAEDKKEETDSPEWTVKPIVADTGAEGEEDVSATDEQLEELPEESAEEQEEQEEPEKPKPHILFVGDSRTIDMFYDNDDMIWGQIHNGVEVYAGHGLGFDFMLEAVNDYGTENFDTLVTWMGANDRGDFSRYRDYYDGLIADGKTIVVCTVGPCDDDHLAEWDHPYYEDSNMVRINKDMVEWASKKGIAYIDMYAYIRSLIPDSLTIDEADGIHYSPRPTRVLWEHILGELNTIGVRKVS